MTHHDMTHHDTLTQPIDASAPPGNTTLDQFVVVLARPEGAWNVGAVCRAMKTMGITRLALVQPAELDINQVQKSALHARNVYHEATYHDSLAKALANTVLSAGFTRRRGTRRKWTSMLPEDLARKMFSIPAGDMALVFGNERAGLDQAELDCCDLACHIPANPEFPSLNLSHAVQVITSAFYRESIGQHTGTYTPIERSGMDALVRVIHQTLDSRSYYANDHTAHTDKFFRDLLSRAMLSQREAAYLEKIFRKLQYLEPADSGYGRCPG